MKELEELFQGRRQLAVQADAGAGGHMESLNAGRLDPGNLNAHFVGQPDRLAAVVMGDMAGLIQLQLVRPGRASKVPSAFSTAWNWWLAFAGVQ
jgi:hypothetical protein